jgi:hypothetical protein
LTVTSADGCCTKRWVVAVVGIGGGLGGLAEGAAEEVDGVALEAEADVCVDGGGDADVGVPEEFLDDDEFDALLQEEGRGRVPEVVKADLAEAGAAEECVEVAGEGGGFDGVAVGSAEDVAVVHPARAGLLLLQDLLLAVGAE